MPDKASSPLRGALADRETQEVAFVTLLLSAAMLAALALIRTDDVPRRFEIFNFLVLQQDYYAVLPFMLVAAAAVWQPLGRIALVVARWCGAYPWRCALLTTAALAAAAPLVYHAHPVSMDEYAPVFQSEAFAAGHLGGQFPPLLLDWLVPRSFQNVFLSFSAKTGEVSSTYWPGFALLLTPFSAIGLPWLLNPLLGGATVVVAHALAKSFFEGDEAAGLAVLLTIASPAITVNAVSFYSMPAHLLLNGLYALLLLRPTARRAVAAGAVGSLALVLHNPVPHLLFAVPWLAWVLMQPARWKLFAALGAGYAPLALLIGVGWSLHLRSLGGASIAATAQPGAIARSALGQLLNVIYLPTGTILEARFLGLVKLWLWAVPGLLSLALLAGLRGPTLHPALKILAASGLLTFFGYFFVPFDQGHGWGYRYFHSAWLALPLLAVAAVHSSPGSTSPSARRPIASYAAACAVLSLVLLTPLRMHDVHGYVERHLAQLPAAPENARSVTIVRGYRGYYASDLVQNDPYLREPGIVLISRGERLDRAMLERLFPDHRLLIDTEQASVWKATSP